MAWFMDRDVRTLLLPYATVAEIERYAVRNRLDGVLLWKDPKEPYFYASPYGPSFDSFRGAMDTSTTFDEAHVAGNWYWYPLRTTAQAARTTHP